MIEPTISVTTAVRVSSYQSPPSTGNRIEQTTSSRIRISGGAISERRGAIPLPVAGRAARSAFLAPSMPPPPASASSNQIDCTAWRAASAAAGSYCDAFRGFDRVDCAGCLRHDFQDFRGPGDVALADIRACCRTTSRVRGWPNDRRQDGSDERQDRDHGCAFAIVQDIADWHVVNRCGSGRSFAGAIGREIVVLDRLAVALQARQQSACRPFAVLKQDGIHSLCTLPVGRSWQRCPLIATQRDGGPYIAPRTASSALRPMMSPTAPASCHCGGETGEPVLAHQYHPMFAEKLVRARCAAVHAVARQPNHLARVIDQRVAMPPPTMRR